MKVKCTLKFVKNARKKSTDKRKNVPIVDAHIHSINLIA